MIAYLLSKPDLKDKKKFNDKVALIPGHRFDGINDGGAWKSSARNHFTSQAMEMDHLLKIVESAEDKRGHDPNSAGYDFYLDSFWQGPFPVVGVAGLPKLEPHGQGKDQIRQCEKL